MEGQGRPYHADIEETAVPTLGPITRIIAAVVGAWSAWGLLGAIHSNDWSMTALLAIVVVAAAYSAVTGLEGRPPRR